MHEKRACQSSSTGSTAVTEIGSGRTSAFSPSRSRCSVSVFAMSTCAPSPAHEPPRRSARRRAPPPARRSCDRSPPRALCCTEGPWSCRCQPMNGPPSYSIVSRQRVTEGSCPSGSRSRAAVRRPSSRFGRRAGPSADGRNLRRAAMFRQSSSTSPGLPEASLPALASSSLIRSPFALEPGPGEGREGADLALDLLSRTGASRSAPRPCRPSRHRLRLRPAAARGERRIPAATRSARPRRVSPILP